MAESLWFYGLEPRWFGWDRLFKVHVLSDGVAGAYLAAQVYDEQSGRMQLIAPAGIAGPLMALWVRQLVRRRAERESFYDSLVPGAPEFMAADTRNFFLPVDDVEEVAVSRKRSLWTAGVSNSGSVRFFLRSGGQRRFVLVNEQNLEKIERALIGSLGESRVNRPDKDA